MQRPDLRLIVITDARLAAPRSLIDIVRAAVAAGAPAIQLRDKSAHARELVQQARALLEITRPSNALLFINDRMDVALASGADGVHLGPDDIPIAAARRVAPSLLIGISTDDPTTAQAAEAAGASYVGCGAVFGTTSKPEVAAEAIGTARLGQVVAAVDIPVVGIGGIDTGNVAQIAGAGAAGCAVIGAVMKADDIAQTVRALLNPFPR
jgi:thiamine-phosphate pyrophosphorylase